MQNWLAICIFGIKTSLNTKLIILSRYLVRLHNDTVHLIILQDGGGGRCAVNTPYNRLMVLTAGNSCTVQQAVPSGSWMHIDKRREEKQYICIQDMFLEVTVVLVFHAVTQAKPSSFNFFHPFPKPLVPLTRCYSTCHVWQRIQIPGLTAPELRIHESNHRSRKFP
jgi:hypothetical protein